MNAERPQWLTEKQVSAMTAISVCTLRNWRHRGQGPEFVKPSPKCVRYSLDSVIKFMGGGK